MKSNEQILKEAMLKFKTAYGELLEAITGPIEGRCLDLFNNDEYPFHAPIDELGIEEWIDLFVEREENKD